MDFIDQIAKVKKPNGEIIRSLETQYRQIGEKFGYVVVQSPLWMCLKKIGSQVGFELQFGNEKEMLESLRRLSASGSDICFFITSSRVKHSKLEDIRAMLLKNIEIKNQLYVFVDIDKGRKIEANREWEKFASKMSRPDWAKPGPMPPSPLFKKK